MPIPLSQGMVFLPGFITVDEQIALLECALELGSHDTGGFFAPGNERTK